MSKVLYSETLVGGASWSSRLRRGQGLRIVDSTGTANVALGILRSDDPSERFNLPDTLKAQFIARITSPYVLYSDMGHVLASVVEDSAGWHDVFAGLGDAKSALQKFGASSYQKDRNARITNARDHFLVELGKYALDEKDLPSAINLFSRISVTENGILMWDPCGQSGQSVSLRMEMDCLVLLSATPHPLNPSTQWNPCDLTIEVLQMDAPDAQDPSRTICPQNERGFTLTERIYA